MMKQRAGIRRDNSVIADLFAINGLLLALVYCLRRTISRVRRRFRHQKMEKKNVGGITYIKQVPNFLKQMMQLDESGVRARSHP